MKKNAFLTMGIIMGSLLATGHAEAKEQKESTMTSVALHELQDKQALMEDMCADMADLAAILTRNDIIAESNIPIEIRFCNSNIVSTLQGIQKKTTDMGDDPAQFLNKEWSNFLKSAEKAVEATHSICQTLKITCRVNELYEENQKATNEDEQNFIDANPNKPDIHKLIVIHEYTQSTETLRAIRQNVSELGVNQQGEAGALSEMHSYLLSIYSDQIIRDKKQKCATRKVKQTGDLDMLIEDADKLLSSLNRKCKFSAPSSDTPVKTTLVINTKGCVTKYNLTGLKPSDFTDNDYSRFINCAEAVLHYAPLDHAPQKTTTILR